MLLERFETFVDRLKEENLGTNVVSVRAYRIWQGIWYDREGKVVENASLVADLNTTMSQTASWHRTRDVNSYFKILELSTVVVGRFIVAANKPTRERFEVALKRCYTDSGNAFDASHHEFTGLLNQNAFRRKVETVLATAKSVSGSTETISTNLTGKTISVLAIDLDYFKRFNDNFGHDYGDIVLKAFANRLREATGAIKVSYSGSELYLGHPHGEEFSVLVEGPTADQALEIAQAVCEAIRTGPIPDEEAWRVFSDPAAGLKLPTTRERMITASVGVASIVPMSGQAVARHVAGDLMKQADIALYKAKSDGKDRACRFSDILAKHGRVLEHRTETNTIIVDVGSQVGCNRGQEFAVYHPDFAGNTDMVVRDARSSRPVGKYPKRSSGHIVAYDVQNEIAFCEPLSQSYPGLYAVGSIVEAVPLGSIAHLIGPKSAADALRVPELASATQLPSAVRSVVDRGGSPAVVVIALSNAAELMSARGNSAVNDSLASLYRASRDLFPPASTIGQSDNLELTIVFPKDDDFDLLEALGRVIIRVQTECSSLPAFKAGVYIEGLYKVGEGDQSELRSTNALEYARFTAVAAAEYVDDIVVFDTDVPEKVLMVSRNQGLITRAMADYDRLLELGINNAALHNQGAICCYLGRDSGKSIEAIAKATQLDPERAIYWANKGLIEYDAGDRDSSLRSLNEGVRLDVKTVSQAPYAAAYAVLLHERWMKGRPAAEKSAVGKWVIFARTLPAESLRADVIAALETAHADLSRQQEVAAGQPMD